MERRTAARLVILAGVGALGLAAACDSSSNGVSTPASDDGGSYDGGGAGTTPDGSSPSDDGGAGPADAASAGPRDPFQAQWKATNDIPTADDYTVDPATGIVTDKTTGLMWSKNALGASDLPPDGGDGNPATSVDARAQCAAATIGGTQGWRLPTRLELLTILTLDQNHTHEPTTFKTSDFDKALLWTAQDDPTSNAYFEGHYNPHSFRGDLTANGWFAAQVHCVKSPYPVTEHAGAPPADRFVKNGNVVADRVTKLEWFAALDPTARMWTQANDYCTNLASGDAGAPAGAKPWRLPTLKEAASLWIEASKGFPDALGLGLSDVYFWTSSAYKPPQGLIANPGYFRIYFQAKDKSGLLWWDVNDFASTLCVRDGM